MDYQYVTARLLCCHQIYLSSYVLIIFEVDVTTGSDQFKLLCLTHAYIIGTSEINLVINKEGS